MKKALLLIIINSIFSIFSSYAQFSSSNAVTASTLGISLSNMNEVFFYYGASSYDITYTSTDVTDFTWYEYTTNPSNATSIQTDNNTTNTTLSVSQVGSGGKGLILDINGVKKYIWLIELKNTASLNISSITASDGSDPCTSTQIDVVLTNPELYYYNSSGIKKTTPRTYTLTYNTLEWNGTAYSTKQITVSKTFSSGTGISQEFLVDAPLTNTTFTLTGDQILSAFNKSISVTTQNEYKAKALKEQLIQTDSAFSILSGSTALVVNIASNVNLTGVNYEWYISNLVNDSNVLYSSDKNLHYTFDNSGRYKVKLVISNGTCISMDSLIVDVTSFGGVQNELVDFLKIYPNPGNNYIFVAKNESIGDSNYKIVNLHGQLLKSGKLSESTNKINIANFPSGIYNLVIQNRTFKFIKK